MHSAPDPASHDRRQPSSGGRPADAPPPPLPHELIQHTLILAAHTLVIDPDNSTPRDFPDPHALCSLALVTPDNYTSLNQFVFLNVPWCSFHDAARRGDIDLMRWWLTKSGMRISDHQFALALFEASRAGRVDVLEFWKAEYPEIEVDPRRVRHVLMGATQAGQVDVLWWWVDHGGFDKDSFGRPLKLSRRYLLLEHPVEYVRAAFYVNCLPAVKFWVGDKTPLPTKLFQSLAFDESFAATGTADDLVALDWLHEHVPDLPAKLSEISESLGTPRTRLDAIAGGGHVHLLQWFLDYCRTHAVPLHAKFDTPVLQAALNGGHVGVLDWWRINSLPVDVSQTLSADQVDSPAALSWLAASGWAFEYTEDAVDLADSVERLDWWLQHCSAAKLKYTELAMDRASDNGCVHLLDWWLQHSSTHGLALKYSTQALDLAAEAGELHVLEWWLASDLELKIHTPLACASRGNHVDVMDWLWEHEVYNQGAEEHLAIVGAINCRSAEALKWLEARGLLKNDDAMVNKIGDLLLSQDDAEVDEYGLSWWMRESKVLDDVAKDRLMGMWRMVYRLNVYDVSDDDQEGRGQAEWVSSVEDEIPFLDIAKA